MEQEMNYADGNRRFQMLKGDFLPNPGKCITCGSVERDCLWFGATNYVHFPGTDGSQDRFAAILICELCLRSAITENPSLGFITLDAHKTALDRVSKDIVRLERADNAVEQLSDELDTVISNYRERLTDFFPGVVSIRPVEAKQSTVNTVKPDEKIGVVKGWDWGLKDE